jgi:hypothetical protein
VPSAVVRAGTGVAAGVATSAAIALIVGAVAQSPASHDRLVPEDASSHLQRVAIHYVPSIDAKALPVWRQLFAVLPPDVQVEVATPSQTDFDHFETEMRRAGVAHLERFHAHVVDHSLTTWSRDRMASLEDSDGHGVGVLSPPRIAVSTAQRAGDWDAPFKLAHDLYGTQPRISDYVFEGGDFAASAHVLYADDNLIGRNLGRGDASLDHLQSAVARSFGGDHVVWLGDAAGDVPEHHIMMYTVPLDDTHALVGDVREGLALATGSLEHDPDIETHAARFDRVAALLMARGISVTRVPVVVLPGAGSYVTYTNAVFDRDSAGPIVYLPTYRQPALDARATAIYQQLGYRVVPIDVSTIYTLNGSLGCLVNVMARSAS